MSFLLVIYSNVSMDSFALEPRLSYVANKRDDLAGNAFAVGFSYAFKFLLCPPDDVDLGSVHSKCLSTITTSCPRRPALGLMICVRYIPVRP